MHLQIELSDIKNWQGLLPPKQKVTPVAKKHKDPTDPTQETQRFRVSPLTRISGFADLCQPLHSVP